MHKLEFLASIFEPVRFDEAQSASPWAQLGSQTHTGEQVSVRVTLGTHYVLSDIKREASLIIFEL